VESRVEMGLLLRGPARSAEVRGDPCQNASKAPKPEKIVVFGSEKRGGPRLDKFLGQWTGRDETHRKERRVV